LLAQAAAHYIFISSESVYANFQQAGIDETYATGTLADETVEEITGETYGPLKVLCEREAQAAFPNRALIIRPGLIVGPHDPTDRFTYWPMRVVRGGEILAPEHAGYAVQFIDVRDLAAWTVSMVEQKQTGVFNADGPTRTLGEVLEASRTQSAVTVTWVTGEFLAENQVAPWSQLPLWIPESDADAAGFARISTEKAQATGLTARPLEETVQATLEWAATRPAEHQWRAGLTPEREAELLQLWREKISR
jgi:2'-hydroxyisoflavone reductase